MSVNQDDLDILRKYLEELKPELTNDQYHALDNLTVMIEQAALKKKHPSITASQAAGAWLFLSVLIERIYELVQEERFDLVDEGTKIFKATLDFITNGGENNEVS